VLRAYRELYDKGIITSIYRKGYFVSCSATEIGGKKILVAVNESTTANASFYVQLSQSLEDSGVQCDIRTYHNNLERLENLIKESAGRYHTFIVEPQMQSPDTVLDLFKNRVLDEEIIILNDGDFDTEISRRNILFEVEKDLPVCLQRLSDRLDSYRTINLVLPSKEYFPYKVIKGFFNYCDLNRKNGNILEEIRDIHKGEAYIFIDEKSLLSFLVQSDKKQVKLGIETGALTLFERPYLEHLTTKITSISWFNKGLIDCIVSSIKQNVRKCLQADAELHLRESL
jgi:hypothetical protein